MNRIVLISCVSKKLSKKTKAKDLYTSTLFKLNMKFAQTFNTDNIFILSAKHGLIDLDDEIAPYDVTLNKMKADVIKSWSSRVLAQLKVKFDLQKDHFIFLAGDKYRKYLIPHIASYDIPLQGKRIGEQLQHLKKLTSFDIPLKGKRIGKQLHHLKKMTSLSNSCHELHHALNNLPMHYHPFNVSDMPSDGIYILFEKGERTHGTNRIVRVGTHTGTNQLRSRLKQHYIKENKDRSIFRKNIGRALLHKNHDPFLKEWDLDLTTKKAKEKYSHLVDFDYQQKIERQVTEYIQGNLFFVVISVEDKESRFTLEARIISTVSNCSDCKPSSNWLGFYSPKPKIRESGLWLENELYKTSLTKAELYQLKKYIKSDNNRVQ